jgi:hypothetical protein
MAFSLFASRAIRPPCASGPRALAAKCDVQRAPPFQVVCLCRLASAGFRANHRADLLIALSHLPALLVSDTRGKTRRSVLDPRAALSLSREVISSGLGVFGLSGICLSLEACAY